MHNSSKTDFAIKQKFVEKKQKRAIARGIMVFMCLIFALGAFSKVGWLEGAGFIGVLLCEMYIAVIWRCPACGCSLEKRFEFRYCSRCGVVLEE